jgi:O-antigen ligase
MTKLRSLEINQIFYYSALSFAFTLSLSRAAISFFLFWFLILFLLKTNFKNSWETIKTNQTVQIIGFFLSFIFISIFWSSNLHEALNQIRLYSYWAIIPILGVSLKKEWLPNIITAFLFGMFVNEILVYGIFFDLWQIKGHTHDDPTLMNHTQYSTFLAITAIILLNRLFSKNYTHSAKLPIALFFLLTTINLFISGSRIGQIAFLIAIALTVLIHYRVTLKSLLIFSTISAFLFIGAYITLPTYKQRIQQAVSDIGMQQKGIYYTSVGLRNGFWMIAFDALQESPIFGAGIGDYKDATKEALLKNNYKFDAKAINFFLTSDYHNQHLMILVQLGLIGFGLMIWLIISLYRLNIKDKEIKELSILSLTIFLISSFGESLWIAQYPIILFVFIASISLASSELSSGEKNAL